jgi:membrane fusion protein (multidrug efflux system)
MKTNYNHYFFTACLTGAAIISGCGGKTPVKSSPDTVAVSVINLDQAQPGHSHGDQLQYNGTVQAEKTVDLSFQVSGTITSLPVQTGQYVHRGELIGTVDETVYRNQYNAQLAQAKLAEENYNRVLDVFKKGSIAEIKMLEARSNYEQATSAAKATYQNIAHTKLFAPRDGYIGDKKIDAGAVASPGTPVIQLLDTRSVNVLVAVPESEINNYKAGNKAMVTIDALGKEPMEGRVSEIGVLALQNSASYNVKVNLINTNKELRPGMLCKVSFLSSGKLASDTSHQQQSIIPAQAVQVDEHGNNYIYVLDTSGKKAIRKQVETGALFNSGIAITSGLSGNEKLITSGYQKLGNDVPVSISK